MVPELNIIRVFLRRLESKSLDADAFVAFFEQIQSYFNSIIPADVDDEVLSELAKVFSMIVDNKLPLKEQNINIDSDLYSKFENLENLSGNLRRMLKKEKDTDPSLGFTKNVRTLKNELNQLAITLARILATTGLIIITQGDLFIEELYKI